MNATQQAYLDHVTKKGGFLGGGQSLYDKCCAPPGFNAETQVREREIGVEMAACESFLHMETRSMSVKSLTYPPFMLFIQYGWDNAAAGVNLLLANITQEKRYKDAVVAHVDGWAWPDGELSF